MRRPWLCVWSSELVVIRTYRTFSTRWGHNTPQHRSASFLLGRQEQRLEAPAHLVLLTGWLAGFQGSLCVSLPRSFSGHLQRVTLGPLIMAPGRIAVPCSRGHVLRGPPLCLPFPSSLPPSPPGVAWDPLSNHLSLNASFWGIPQRQSHHL